MARREWLCNFFNLSPNHTDKELRHAYLKMMKRHHPDKNPEKYDEANAKCQEINSYYEELKRSREYSHPGSEKDDLFDSRATQMETFFDPSQYIFVSPNIIINLDDISRRKKFFRDTWEAMNRNPHNLIYALNFIHAAFEAERQGMIIDLLKNPTLIDSASLLFQNNDRQLVFISLIKWSDVLYQNQMLEESIEILNDALAVEKVPELKEELRKKYYSCAQGNAPGMNGKPTPEIRLKHLLSIIELGFEFDYIYKLAAEAYLDAGNEEQSRIYLEKAYSINPDLNGAIKISRRLGAIPKDKSVPQNQKKHKKYRYSKLEQIPSLRHIQNAVSARQLNELLEYAYVKNYSPSILPKARNSLRYIAQSLGDFRDQRVLEVLSMLAQSIYWDVRKASMITLAKIGDIRTLKFLKKLPSDNGKLDECRKNAISHLSARLSNKANIVTVSSLTSLINEARRALERSDYGKATVLYESILQIIQKEHPSYREVIVSTAHAYGKMGNSGEAIKLIMVVYKELPTDLKRQVSIELLNWLWENLVFEDYDSVNDEKYLLAVQTTFDIVIFSDDPSTVLYNLKYLTRWMEILGEVDLAQWVRELIRKEAPGTVYVDSHDRENYIRKVELSKELKSKIDEISKSIKTRVPAKLRIVLRSCMNEGGILMIDGE